MRSRTLCVVMTTVAFVLFASAQVLAEKAPRVPANVPSAVDLMNLDPIQEASDRATMQKDILDKGGFLPSFGNWFDPTNPGWGFDIQMLGDFLFAVWFTYNPDGTPTWYIIAGQLAAKGDGMSLSGNIDSFKWDPGTQTVDSSVVGTMNIIWADENSAKAVWTLNGEDGVAGITFTPFAPGVAFNNMTGHYFQPFASGWGYTLLTQGDVTVLTIYWYKDGQPVWAQGVFTDPRYVSIFFTLNYFFGPGLCPSCLDDNKAGPAVKFEADPLANVTIQYTGPAGPPSDVLIAWSGTPGTQLGSSPFSDLLTMSIAPTATSAITAASMDFFDPTYADLGQLLSPLQLGNCLPFEYDTGLFANDLTGTFETAYFMLAPDNQGGLPVYSNANCTTPFGFPYEIEGISRLWSTRTGGTFEDEGNLVTPIMMAWGGSRFGFSGGAGDCDIFDRVWAAGGRWVGPDDSINIRLHGFTRSQTAICENGLRLPDNVGGFDFPSPSVDISKGVLDNVSIRTTYD